MWEPALSSPMSWNSMSCTTVPESQSSPESPECGRSAAEATSQTLKKSSAWIQNSLIYNFSMIATVITTSLDGVWVPWFTKKMNNKGYREINKVAVDYVNLMTYAMCCLIMVAPEVVKILASKPYWEGIVIIPPVVLSNYIIFVYTMYVNVEHYYKKRVTFRIISRQGCLTSLLRWELAYGDTFV